MKKKLYQLLEKATKNQKLNINKNYKMDQLKGWDSLSNMNFLLSIEEIFKIRFNTKEISSLKDMENIFKTLNKKKKK